MDLKIKLTTKKKNQTTINYEVQSPINQVFKDRIREKNDRFFFTKKNTLFGRDKTGMFQLETG